MSELSISTRESFPGIRGERGEIRTEFESISPNEHGDYEVNFGTHTMFLIRKAGGPFLRIKRIDPSSNLAITDGTGNERWLFGISGKTHGSGDKGLYISQSPLREDLIEIFLRPKMKEVLKVIDYSKGMDHPLEKLELKIETTE